MLKTRNLACFELSRCIWTLIASWASVSSIWKVWLTKAHLSILNSKQTFAEVSVSLGNEANLFLWLRGNFSIVAGSFCLMVAKTAFQLVWLMI